MHKQVGSASLTFMISGTSCGHHGNGRGVSQKNVWLKQNGCWNKIHGIKQRRAGIVGSLARLEWLCAKIGRQIGKCFKRALNVLWFRDINWV